MLFVPLFRKKAYTLSRCSFVHKCDRQFALYGKGRESKVHNHRRFVQYFNAAKRTPKGVLRYGWICVSILREKKTVVNALLLSL